MDIRIVGLDDNGNHQTAKINGDSLNVIGGVDPYDAPGTPGTNDNDVIYDTNDDANLDLGVYNTHYVECNAGTVDVDVSIDGVNWIAAVAGRDIVSTTPTTLAIDAASGTCLEIIGNYNRLRVNQKGATASNARIRHAVV